MFQITSLGHHGWLFRTPTTTLAVDPVLGPRFAFTRDLVVWPERRIDLDRLPRLDAIFLTHEHEGHFDPWTLSVLPREIPIWIPARSSTSMARVIEEMGFVVRRARPGVPIVVQDLVLHPIVGDQVAAGIEEWDCLAYVVADAAGHGTFFTHVDVRLTEAMREQVHGRFGAPGLWAVTANEHQYAFQSSWRSADRAAGADLAQGLLDDNRWFEQRGAAPQGLLLVGGGWAFEGPLAWLNRNAFPVDPAHVADGVARLLPHRMVARPQPGETWTFVDGTLVAADAPDVGVAPASPTSRVFVGDVEWLEDYAPACGRAELTGPELATLRAELDGFAAALYASHTFRTLLSLDEADLGDRVATFALVLRADERGGAYVFAYSIPDCAFLPVACDAPTDRYLAVFECWATDLLDTFLVRHSQNTLAFGRSRTWNADPERFAFNLGRELFLYVHPLRFPDRFLALYRSAIAALPEAPRRPATHRRFAPHGWA